MPNQRGMLDFDDPATPAADLPWTVKGPVVANRMRQWADSYDGFAAPLVRAGTYAAAEAGPDTVGSFARLSEAPGQFLRGEYVRADGEDVTRGLLAGLSVLPFARLGTMGRGLPGLPIPTRATGVTRRQEREMLEAAAMPGRNTDAATMEYLRSLGLAR